MNRKDLNMFIGCGCLILILIVTSTIKEDISNYLQSNSIVRGIVALVLSLVLVFLGITYINLAFPKYRILYRGKSPLSNI